MEIINLNLYTYYQFYLLWVTENFFRNFFKTINHKIRLFLSRINNVEDRLIGFCLKNHIHATKINNPNEIEFENLLKTLKPDLIINQSQYIIKKIYYPFQKFIN